MYKIKQKTSLVLVCLFVLLAVNIAFAAAQSTATVTVQTATGGTTDVTGTTTYPDGTAVTITATPDNGYVFSSWVVSPDDGSGDMLLTDNPVTFTVTGGVTYSVTPVFIVPSAPPGQTLPQDLSKAAIVVVLESAGGTVSPPPGTYALADATSLNLKATPSNGWTFSHWTICGTQTSHGNAPTNWDPTDNPYNVNHGYGDVYRYQAVFTPVGSVEPTPSPSISGGTLGGMSNDTWIIIGLVIVIIAILIGFGVYAARRKK